MTLFTKLPSPKAILIAALVVLMQPLAFGQSSVARQWSETQLSCIRKYFAKPTVHARHLSHVSIAMYDAWAVYDDEAQPYLLGQTWGSFNCPFNGIPMPADGNLLAAQEKAISYAAYRTLWNRYTIFAPGANLLTIQGYLNDRMASLGYDTGITSTDYSDGDPAKLGNYIAAKLQEFALQDGSNQQGNYANLQYQPINGQLQPAFPGNPSVVDPNRWQALVLSQCIDQNNIPIECPAGTGTPALSHEWGNVIPFALTEDQADTLERDGLNWKVYLDPGPPPLLDTTVQTGLDESFFKWGYVMNIIWHSFHNNDDGVMVDASPNNIGGLNITSDAQLPQTFQDYQDFYNLLEGGVNDPGHDINPATNEPYEEQLVPRKDFTRVLSQYWADGPNSETPPGHWFKLFNEVEDKMDLIGIEKRWMGEELVSDLEWDVKGYFALGGGIHDAAIACWGTKGYYDYTRPIMAIRWMGVKGQSTDPNLPHYHPAGLPLIPGYIELVLEGDTLAGENNEHLHKIKVFSWKGPFAATGQDGAGWLLAENWWTYQAANFVTPPFAGYYSGHSTYSRTGAEIMTLITGDEYFPGGMAEFVATQDEYLIADDGPSTTIKLQWATYRDASDQCSVSRIYGGLHPPQDDIPGRKVGLIVGPQAVNKANEFIHANPPQVAVTYSAPAVSDIHVGGLWYMDVQFDKPMDTLVAPQLIFLNATAANTLTYSSGFWLNNQTYRATYAVVDLNVTVTGIAISIQQARDMEGITNVPAVGAPITIDTQNPAGIATIIGGESVLNELSVLTNAEVDLFIEFNEAMNQEVDLQISLLDIANNAGLTLSALSDWTSSTTYHAVFTLADANAEIFDGDIEISGAVDAAGNEQLITMLNDVISIDTRAPQGEVATSVNMVTDAEAGLTLTISVTSDSPMNTTSNPVLVFDGITESENFQFTNGQWIDGNTFEFTYAILDGNIQTNAQIVIAGSTDENGNLLNTTGNNDMLAIDTQNPTLTSVTPSVMVLSDDDVAGGLTVDLVFSEDMNTMLQPQAAFTAENPLSSSLTENMGASAWLNSSTYRLSYSATDVGEELNAIDISITGMTDANGNNQAVDLNAANIFRIDTRNPVVISMTPSTNALTTGDIGTGTFSIDMTFDEAMDQISEPAISFSSMPTINFIANNNSQWNSATNYTAVYDIPNETLQIPSVDIALAFGAIDLAGNSAQVFSVSNAFSVDVVNSVNDSEAPSVLSVYPNPTGGSERLYIQWPQVDAVISAMVYNSVGQCIETIQYNGTDSPLVMNVTPYASGTYYLRLHSSHAEISLPFSVTH
jgi:hypothetical protein